MIHIQDLQYVGTQKEKLPQLTPTIADGKIQSVAITKAGRGYEDPVMWLVQQQEID